VKPSHGFGASLDEAEAKFAETRRALGACPWKIKQSAGSQQSSSAIAGWLQVMKNQMGLLMNILLGHP